MSEYDTNVKVAQEILDTCRLNGREFQRGECVALLDGKVVAVEKTLDAAAHALRTLDSNPERGMLFEVGPQID